jgi:hypothetical protein
MRAALTNLDEGEFTEGHELDRKTETERDDRTQVVSGGGEEIVGQVHGHVRLEGFANQFVVHPHQKLVSCWIEPRHGRTKRACDPVYGAMD